MEAGEILYRRGLIDESQLQASRNGNNDGVAVLDRAVKMGFVNEDQALQALGEEVGREYIDLRSVDVYLSLLKGFPTIVIHRASLCPIRADHV